MADQQKDPFRVVMVFIPEGAPKALAEVRVDETGTATIQRDRPDETVPYVPFDPGVAQFLRRFILDELAPAPADPSPAETHPSEVTGAFCVRLDEHTANCGELTLDRREDGTATLRFFPPVGVERHPTTVPVATVDLAGETARAGWTGLTTA